MEQPRLELPTRRLMLRLLAPDEAPRVLAYYERNREHLAPWEPVRPPSFYTLTHWRAALEQGQEAFAKGSGVRLYGVLRERPGAELVCQVALNNVIRGVFQACYLGYSVDAAHEGQGLAREAVEAVVGYGFRRLRLHRVMANYVPHNVRSGRLLRQLGFRVEGYAHDYLKIAGRWQDHIMTSRLNPAAR